MKRWDQTTLAVNVGQQIDAHYKALHSLVAPYLKKPKKGEEQTAIEKLLTEVFNRASSMQHYADVVVGAASNRYPLHGLEAWMFENESASIRHPFEEGTRREWLAAAAIMQFCSEIAKGTRAIRANLYDLESTHDPDVGMTAAAIGQWNYMIEEVALAFLQVRAFLSGGPLEDVDWRALGLLEMIPEPIRSQIEARCEARYAQALSRWKLPTPAEEISRDIAEWSKRTGKTEEEFWEQGGEFLEIEKIEVEMSAYALAKKRLRQEAQTKALHKKAMEEERKASEPKPVSKALQKGREMAAARKKKRLEREKKAIEKRMAKAAKDAQRPDCPVIPLNPSADADDASRPPSDNS